jgi:hypothetical protein
MDVSEAGGSGGPGGAGGTARASATSAAFGELVEELRNLESRLRSEESGLDTQGLLEGYRWIFSILAVGLDAYVWADKSRPRFVDIVGPYRKWGGDNADAFYQYAPIDPAMTYRVTGRRGDAVYMSLTVYGGPDDGHYSERIVGSLNDRSLEFGPDGSFEVLLSPEPQAGAWIKLEPDAVCAVTRDYMADPAEGRRVEWHIEAVDPSSNEWKEEDSDLARKFRAALTWVRDQSRIVPVPLGEPNTVGDPYPVPAKTFGWGAGDAAYAMGSFSLGADQALVLEGTSPECAFWNLCLWNRLLHTYNYDYERVTINGFQVRYEADGSWKIVVAARDPGHPNWVSTAGHREGRIWFRWFLPEGLPQRPRSRVAQIGETL